MVSTRKKSAHEFYDTELKSPAVLNLQVWDNDTFSPDDFLGTLSIDLSNIPKPSRLPAGCNLKRVITVRENLFAKKGSVRGWFPVYGKTNEDESIRQTVG